MVRGHIRIESARVVFQAGGVFLRVVVEVFELVRSTGVHSHGNFLLLFVFVLSETVFSHYFVQAMGGSSQLLYVRTGMYVHMCLFFLGFYLLKGHRLA